MSPEAVAYRINHAGLPEILGHLTVCSPFFRPPLSSRVDLDSYSRKLLAHATRFECWAAGELVGLVAAYLNGPDAFVTSVSVTPESAGRGIGSRLLTMLIDYAEQRGVTEFRLEVDPHDPRRIAFYAKFGFVLSPGAASANGATMTRRPPP